MSTSAASVTDSKGPKKSSTCTNCRERHLKCDGGVVCSRCKSERTQCIYVASRRGQRKPSNTVRRHEIEGGFATTTAKVGGPNKTIWTTPIVMGGKPPDFNSAENQRPPMKSPLSREPSNQLERTRTATSVHLLSLFYSYFFQTHPFVLPRAHLSERFAKNERPQLQAAVEFIGACYDLSINRADYLEPVNQRLFSNSPPQDGFTVQALLLLSIGLHASNEKERAIEIIKRAVSLALDLGMHTADFAKANGNGDVILEECWRRTLWELYIVERTLAAESHSPESILITRDPPMVALPCEESEYLAGHVYRHRTFEDYLNRAFMGDDVTFPSYAYRIDAARILANTLPLAYTPTPDETYIEKVDHELGQWCLYLPEDKRTLVPKDGLYDEVLFHAHALTFIAAIFLHRPRSKLAMHTFGHPTLDCFPRVPSVLPSSSHSASYHTAFLVRAAESVAKLVSIPRNSLTHTPLFTFCMLLGASTYLSSYNLLSGNPETGSPVGQATGRGGQLPTPDLPLQAILGTSQSQIKDQIRLEIGALKRVGQVWSSARVAHDEIRSFSMQLFTTLTPLNQSPASDVTLDPMSHASMPRQQSSTNIPIHPSMIPSAMPVQAPLVPIPQPQAQMHYDPGFQAFGQISQTDVLPMEYYMENPNSVFGSYGSDGSLNLGYQQQQRPNNNWGSFTDLQGLTGDNEHVTAS